MLSDIFDSDDIGIVGVAMKYRFLFHLEISVQKCYYYFNYRKDLTYLLPGAVRKLSNYDPQKWINRIHHHSSEVMRRNPYDCKAKFVGKFVNNFYTMIH